MARVVTATLLLLAALGLLASANAQTLDDTFGDAGYWLPDRQGFPLVLTDVETDVKRRPIVAYNSGSASGGSATIVRLFPDGRPDTGFAGTGSVTIDRDEPRETIRRLAIHADERIVGAGTAYEIQPNRLKPLALLVRVSENGQNQESWVYDLGEQSFATDVAILNDGSFYALSISARNGSARSCGVLVVRANGARFDGFGEDGYAELPYADCTTAGVEASGGGIAVAGTRTENDDRDVFIARFQTDGTLDPRFGDAGAFVRGFVDADERATDLTAGPDGDVLLSGSGEKAGQTGLVYFRANADGTGDEFGDGGFVFVGDPDLERGIQNSEFEAIAPSSAIDAEGRVTTATSTANPFRLTLVRFLSDGNLDASFGSLGFVRLDNPARSEANATGRAVTIDLNGRVVFAGDYLTNGNSRRLLIGRLGAEGTTVSSEAAPLATPLALYPNPARQMVWVAPEGDGTVRIVDVLGREVYAASTARGRRLSVPTGRFAPGVYSVLASGPDGTQTARLTVVR